MFARLLSLNLLMFAVCSLAFGQDKVGTTAAPFLSINVGARASAMGGAYVAYANDLDGLHWNPAGLTQINQNGATFTNANWFVGSQFYNAVGALKLGENNGTLAIRVMSLNYGDIQVTTVDRPEGTGEVFQPQDLSVGVSYGRNLTEQFSFGATVKFVNQNIWSSNASTLALDLGVLYVSKVRGFRIGMSVANFGGDLKMTGDDLRVAHDISGNNGNNDRLAAILDTKEWPLPLMFRVGIGVDVFRTERNYMIASLDAKHPNDNAPSFDAGFEYGFRDLLYLRGGYRNLLIGEETDSGFTAGFGASFSYQSSQIDVGYSYQVHKYLDSPQLISVTVYF